MLKRFFMNFLAIFFPWLILLMEDNPGGALVAAIMQATVIGWIPASIWAWQTVHPKKTAHHHTNKKEK